MLTLGTAGHIDHGKSSIVKALTSIDPDRLPEEKERGMTIDLGFAWFALPSGEKVGLVDVPGHQHFVRNVIPGLTGIDAVMLIVAADDGWMPQTEEHLQIIDLLGINRGLVVLNKMDLAEADWRDMVKADIASHLGGTSLEQAPIIEVSARTGAGIDSLKAAIENLARYVRQEDAGKPRLPIDRVFNIKGSGTVITGTLHGGHLSVGDALTILPRGLSAHVRGIESYKEHLQRAAPGSRVALNLSGVKKDELERGDIIVRQGQETPLSRYLDADLTLLPTVKQPLKTGAEVSLFFETAELPARVIALEGREVIPGAPALVQLRLDREAAATIGERFILRKSSPAETIGGGRILDPAAERYQLKNAADRLARLAARRRLDADSIIRTELSKTHFALRRGFLRAAALNEAALGRTIEAITKKGDILLKGEYLIGGAFWQEQQKRLISSLAAVHQAEPLKKGLPQAEAAAKLPLPPELFAALVDELASQKKIIRAGDVLALSTHKPALSGSQEEMEKRILAAADKDPAAPPTRTELLQSVPEASPVLRYMLEQGRVVELPEGILMTAAQYRATRQKVIDVLKSKGQIAIQDMAALTGFSRKYSIPFLTRLDQEGITRRQENVRVPARKLE
ncbi:selenocysteine-specific elongation factor SelB [Dehalogenimonas alkenigignens]|uniref:Selenocysteine-specific elongation factor n=1 Tax=Dehalogenimonas alkenigignens TaxID=1217799 RepID=A0A0W0GGH0_9CHLR|nr:selenocysteine-specific translation elongation factor [Dehalogenimonas alkenigignens]KTB47650.1 selenocysteine-specific elongation factor SelB [Dehalogenimonas alkenigignens]